MNALPCQLPWQAAHAVHMQAWGRAGRYIHYASSSVPAASSAPLKDYIALTRGAENTRRYFNKILALLPRPPRKAKPLDPEDQEVVDEIEQQEPPTARRTRPLNFGVNLPGMSPFECMFSMILIAPPFRSSAHGAQCQQLRQVACICTLGSWSTEPGVGESRTAGSRSVRRKGDECARRWLLPFYSLKSALGMLFPTVPPPSVLVLRWIIQQELRDNSRINACYALSDSQCRPHSGSTRIDHS